MPDQSLPAQIIGLIVLAGFYAGAQNALAGGGSFITFPTLLLAGLNPLDSNITSTIALFPSQIASCLAGKRHASGIGAVSLKQLIMISLVGGISGALLLLHTSPAFFAKLVPWLLLFATTVFSWGSFRNKSSVSKKDIPPIILMLTQFCISIYGGYFGAGIGFLMLAALTIAGQQVKTAGATKNMLAMMMNIAAVIIFAFSGHAHWLVVIALGIGGIFGGITGGLLMYRIPEKLLRCFVIFIGVSLTLWMFIK